MLSSGTRSRDESACDGYYGEVKPMFRRKDSYKIFISYEREDASGWAGIIYQQLKEGYGEGLVFKDEEETRTGTDWPPRLARLVRKCKAFVLIVGLDWNDARVIGKLNDPNSWVHQEIVMAVDAQKKIFPVVVEGAVVPTKEKVPEKISQALGLHHLRFNRQNSKRWPEDIERLCMDIEAQTGVRRTRLPAIANRVSLDRVLCRLDRQEHFGSAHEGWFRADDPHQIFLAYGGKKAGFRYFALRCALDIVAQHHHAGRPAARDDSPKVKPLNWGIFSGSPYSPTRPTMLLKEIAESVFTEKQAGNERNALEAWLTDRIQKNNRPTVVYSTAPQGEDWVRIQEWFKIWQRLLQGDQARTIAVMLFVESGWWSWSQPDVQRLGCGAYLVSHKMDKIHQTDLNQWLGADVQERVAEQLRGRLSGECHRLYRFRRARHFDDISKAVKALWT
jgi:hypothetical protein